MEYTNNNRILVKDTLEEVNISDGKIIEYTACYYYKKINIIKHIAEVQTNFIGIVETSRGNEYGPQGIYIKPLYIYDCIIQEWKKIINYPRVEGKYFLYPHLLMLPGEYYNYHPLYFLHTCGNRSLSDYEKYTNTFDLDD